MPPGTVTTRLRLRPGVVSTTYAVITLVIEPIGRSSTEDLDHRSAPVAAFASSAKRDRTPRAARRAALAAAVAARAAGAVTPPATIIPATTAPAASAPAIRMLLPLPRPNEDTRILPVRPPSDTGLRLNSPPNGGVLRLNRTHRAVRMASARSSG